MEPTRRNAEAMLRDAGKIETTVRSKVPQEHPLYVAMALTTLLLGMAVDLNIAGGVASMVGATLALVALAVTVATNFLYLRRYRQVRMRRTPKWLEWGLGLWSAAALFTLGILLDDTVGFSFTLGGTVGAWPFLLWAQLLRRAV